VLRGGVTEAWDLGWPAAAILPLCRRSRAGDFPGPRLRAAGPMITAVGGYPARASWAPSGTTLEVRGPAEAAAAVERLFGLGADLIKVALNADAGPVLTDEELRAACRAAAARGLQVAAHAQGAGQTVRALAAGVGLLAHCPWEPLPGAVLGGVAARMTTIGTLDIHAGAALEQAQENLARIHAAGGRVLHGTDLGNGPVPPGIHAGETARAWPRPASPRARSWRRCCRARSLRADRATWSLWTATRWRTWARSAAWRSPSAAAAPPREPRAVLYAQARARLIAAGTSGRSSSWSARSSGVRASWQRPSWSSV
jgi:hypothetical protein